MKTRILSTLTLLALLAAIPACTSTGYSVREYKPDKRQTAVEYTPGYPLQGPEKGRVYIGLIKKSIVNYTEYYLTSRYVGKAPRRYHRRNYLVIDTGKKKLRLRAIPSLNKVKKLDDGKVEETNQYRLSWGGLGIKGRASHIDVTYSGKSACCRDCSFGEKDLKNFRLFIKTYSQKHVRL